MRVRGHPESAYGTGGRTAEKRGDISDHCDVKFNYANNIQATLTGFQIAPNFCRSVNEQFYGSNGVIQTAREYFTHYRRKGDAVTEKSPREITIDALATFVKNIPNGSPEIAGVRGAERTLTAIMGGMAIEQKRQITWTELLKG